MLIATVVGFVGVKIKLSSTTGVTVGVFVSSAQLTHNRENAKEKIKILRLQFIKKPHTKDMLINENFIIRLLTLSTL